MYISDFTVGKNNNFNAIRMVAAFTVLIAHSFALTKSTENPAYLAGVLSSIAVDIFFITSGFLVTASLITRQNMSEFLWARILRIYPALWLMLLLTVFGLGAFLTSMKIDAYLTDSLTHHYLYKCGTLAAGVSFDLPGVFVLNPFKNSVNGSLWTLPYEVKCYIILGLIWIALRFMKQETVRLFKIAVATTCVGLGVYVVACQLNFPNETPRERLFFMFFYGAVFYCLKEYIKLSKMVFLGVFVTLVATFSFNGVAFSIVYILTIAYCLFYLAYIPSGWYRKYNKLGDYSYGTYIYAFPIQQSVAALIPGVDAWSMMAISTVSTIVLAVFSWHVIERRALALKDSYVNRTQIYRSWLKARVGRIF